MFAKLRWRKFAGVQQPLGHWFIRRVLVRGQEDPTHFMNLRFFDKVDSYLECTQRPGYVNYTEKMYTHMKPYESYPREFVDVVLDTGPSTAALDAMT